MNSYNAYSDLIESRLKDYKDNIAYIDDEGKYTYHELDERISNFANNIINEGFEIEDKIILCLLDTIDFPVAFLGCIKAGVIPIPVNTLLTEENYKFILNNSRAKGLIYSNELHTKLSNLISNSVFIKKTYISGEEGKINSFNKLLTDRNDCLPKAVHNEDDECFWLYSSGSTGNPKGTVHVHKSLVVTNELYAKNILNIKSNDIIFSAAKLFFAYGLGNALTFPLCAGATTVLSKERPTPDLVFSIFEKYEPSLFFGVPTLYSAMLNSEKIPSQIPSRLCISAGEALPIDIGMQWEKKFNIKILDGIGSTEMLHIFLSNSEKSLKYGTTGKPVPGYEVILLDENSHPVKQGEIGELRVKGPSSALKYWRNVEKTKKTFIGEYTVSGDKYYLDEDGFYVYAGRADDMLKVSGQYVSPFEVESALISHNDVIEAAVVGRKDDAGLVKPHACVVLVKGSVNNEEKKSELKDYVKNKIAPFKYPRWIEFVDELPKTATGKIQRFKLRENF